MAVPKNFSRYICMWLSVWHISIQTVTSEEDLLLARPDKVLRRRFLQQNLQSPRQHRRSDFDVEEDEANTSGVGRQGRLFSNPFGILGHDSCHATVDSQNMTGICYNEVECVVRGGIMSGYCGPPAVKGVCCVFSTSDCEKRVREKTFYFKNKSYPRNDLVPFQCQLKIKPIKDVCWIRFDYIDFELMSDGSGGTCVYDSMGIMDSPDGPGGRICGFKTGYATVTRDYLPNTI